MRERTFSEEFRAQESELSAQLMVLVISVSQLQVEDPCDTVAIFSTPPLPIFLA